MSADIEDLIVVNALGGLDNPNAPASASASGALVQTSDQLTIDERTLADAHASGVTAINVTLGYTLGDFPPYRHTLDEIRTWDAIIDAHPRDLMRIGTAADIAEAKRQRKIGIIYGFQNAAAVEDRPERVAEFAGLGVRIIQLTYNQANRIGDGSMAPGNRGLTPLGREVVEALNEQRVMVDLSHSGERTCLEAARVSAQPVSINHTGCRALVDLPRNKTDEELRLVASRGGFVGIYFMPFVNATGHATAADVVEHISHAVDVCGEDHVGIGTDGTITAIDDLDGYRALLAEQVAQRQAAGASAAGERADTFPFVVDLRGVDQFRELARLLDERGYSATRIEKILGLNFHNYAKAVWGS
ncbi:MAG TPA: membrane dipeptidase [Spirillospora sp.]|nr:membrane dipeptidase [Spirillospora sp.]